MLKPSKRITKRQLKEDKFITYYFKTLDFVEKNSRQILTGVGTVLVLSIAVFIYSQKQATKENEALVELSKATKEYASANFQNAETILKNLLENYGGTNSGELAQFYLGNTYFELENYTEAEKYYREFANDTDDPVLGASSLSGLAACLEEQGKFAEAAELYKQTAEKYRDAVFAPENLYHSARCFILAGQQDMARSVLNRLIEEYSDASIENDAQVLLAELAS
jgi:TolA-binding protein